MKPRPFEIPSQKPPSRNGEFLTHIITTQEKILEGLPDEASRERWVADNAKKFRELADTDEEFRRMIEEDDLDGIATRLATGS